MKFACLVLLVAALFSPSCTSANKSAAEGASPAAPKSTAQAPVAAGASAQTPIAAKPPANGADPNFWIFLCFGQSNMEGYSPVTIDAQDKVVDKRFQMLACVDFNAMGRKMGNWYDAVPPLVRQSTGLCPVDYFGRTMVANTPANIRIGVVAVAVAGCKIEMFDKDTYKTYISTQAGWMQNISKQYGDNPYQRLVDMGKIAQKSGVIKGILLHQGESNSGDRQWPAKVKKIYGDLLTDLDLKAEDVPLIAGQPVSTSAIIQGLPTTVPTAHVVSSTGCEARQDHLHFTFAGYRELGKRYAEATLPVLGIKVVGAAPAKAQ